MSVPCHILAGLYENLTLSFLCAILSFTLTGIVHYVWSFEEMVCGTATGKIRHETVKKLILCFYVTFILVCINWCHYRVLVGMVALCFLSYPVFDVRASMV